MKLDKHEYLIAGNGIVVEFADKSEKQMAESAKPLGETALLWWVTDKRKRRKKWVIHLLRLLVNRSIQKFENVWALLRWRKWKSCLMALSAVCAH